MYEGSKEAQNSDMQVRIDSSKFVLETLMRKQLQTGSEAVGASHFKIGSTESSFLHVRETLEVDYEAIYGHC